MSSSMNVRGIYVRLALAASLLLVSAVASLSMAPSASATWFCSSWLAKYGAAGDKCWGPAQKGLTYASVNTPERAGCVNIADGANNLTQSWACGPQGYAPAAQVWMPISETYYKGVIRNNNTNYPGSFIGEYACWTLYPC